jgi:hypothetical protein
VSRPRPAKPWEKRPPGVQFRDPLEPAPLAATHFLTLYEEAAGRWIIPRVWHRWCAISLIAACVRDRVWFELIQDDPLFPNLYVMLVGASGGGKNKAIDHAVRFSEAEPALINCYRGSVTRAALTDWLGRPVDPVDGGALSYGKTWLVTPELAMSVGNPAMAEDFVKFVTEIYGGAPIPLRANTRTHGDREVVAPCLNWLSGTTEAWLRRALPPYLVEGGFVARLVPVYGAYDGPRMASPEYPEGVQEMRDHLKARVKALTTIGGPFEMSPLARRVYNAWVLSRPEPSDPRLAEWWAREPALCLKLAMVMSLAESDSLMLTTRHMVQARELIHETRPNVLRMLDEVAMTAEIEDARLVESIVYRAKEIPWSTVQRVVSRRGIDHERLEAATKTAIGAGTVAIMIDGKRGRRKLLWVGPDADRRPFAGVTVPKGWRILRFGGERVGPALDDTDEGDLTPTAEEETS